jgi:signal transduction histidine kinase/DNA-binding NarL/FixJ family response regulator
VNATAATQPLRVVIVDDTPDLRDLLRLAMESGGFDVVAEAADGAEAIEVARQYTPDVILLDLAMPVMDGLEALPTLRQLCPDAKIVVLSGFGAAQMTRRALAAGADGYLQKGVPLRTILDYVRDVTSDDAPHPPRALTVVPEQPPQRTEQPPPPPPADSARLAPFGIVEIANESLYRVISVNDAANELLGRTCRPGTPLYAAAPALASLVVVHGDHDSDTFEVDQLDRRLSAVIRRGGDSLFIYLRETSDDQDLQRRVVTAAHELRSPATVIQGLAETLLTGDADLEDAERSRLLDAIAQQAELLDTVAGDLLVPAQAEHGNLRIEPGRVDPAAVLRSQAAPLGDVVVEVDDDRRVVADPRRLEQMVHNLVSNAAKYGHPPYMLRVRAADDPAYLSLDIADRGPGVPDEFRDQLFDEYTRAEGTAVEGVGLGLYVVQVLAQAQGGTVAYAEHPDGGAVFTLSLPASE